VASTSPTISAPGRPAGRRGQRFPWIPFVVLCVVAVLLVAVGTEIVLQVGELGTARALGAQCAGSGTVLDGQKGLFEIDAAAGYVMRPGVCVQLRSQEYDQVLRTNNRGFAGPDVPDTKAPGEFRVVVLGDSYTVGGQVPYEQNFTALLESRLRADGHGKVRVINAGVGGYTTFNEAGLLRENLGWLQPDLVVVAAYVGNDTAENVLATHGGYRDAPEHPKGVTWGPEAARLLVQSASWFSRNGVAGDVPPPWDPARGLPRPVGNVPAGSAVADAAPPGPPPTVGTRVRQVGRALWDGARARSLLLGKLFGEPVDPSVTTAPGGTPPSTQQKQMNVASFEWTLLREPPRTYWLDVAWPLFGEYLGQVDRTAASVGAPAVVLAIPEMGQFDDAMRARSMSDFRLREDEVDWDRPQRQLAVQARDAGMPMLDLLPTFRERADRDRLYLRLDTHLTALGHEATAEQLAQFLEGGGWLR